MTILAYAGFNPVARDILIAVGLGLAAALLVVLATSQVKSSGHRARRMLVAALACISIVAVLWSLSEPAFRLVRHQRTVQTTDSLLQFVLGLSDSDLQTFGVRPHLETWEGIPADGYQRLLARAKSEGQLDAGGGSWTGEGQFADLWGRPLRIAVMQTGGKRYVSVSSLGTDGIESTVDDIASSGSVEITKR